MKSKSKIYRYGFFDGKTKFFTTTSKEYLQQCLLISINYGLKNTTFSKLDTRENSLKYWNFISTGQKIQYVHAGIISNRTCYKIRGISIHHFAV